MAKPVVRKPWHVVAALGALAALVVVLCIAGLRARALESKTADIEAPQADAGIPRVEVVHPKAGGMQRLSVQPGSVHSFESVELYAMVSGYLKTQDVDIGSRVRKGQVLAVIDAPREATAVDEAAANLAQANAQAAQAEALVKTMEAERDTAAATVAQTDADVDRLVANHKLADAQFARIKSLYEQRAVDKRLVDEQTRDLEASVAAEKTGRLAVLTARARLVGANAKVEQARADLTSARAAVGVAEAHLKKARVDLNYTSIVAPFDGVVTHRGFHPGAFIRSAADGSQDPLLTVVRTDLMRVVVRIPDRDVVLTNTGDPVVLKVDGLQGRTFQGTVSRIGHSEDHTTRTMRVEIDLPNPDDLLHEGMYGTATVTLEPPSQKLTIPVRCIADRTGSGRGSVQVVRDGKIARAPLELGTDNGTSVEVASGLSADDLVVLRSSTPLEPGTRVIAQVAQ